MRVDGGHGHSLRVPNSCPLSSCFSKALTNKSFEPERNLTLDSAAISLVIR